MRILFLLLAIQFAFLPSFSNSNLPKKDKLKLRLTGKVFELDGFQIDSFDVRVFDHNDLVKEILNQQGKFYLELPLHTQVTLEVSKAGYYTKRIIVDSSIDTEKERKPFTFIFDFSLIREGKLSYTDDFVMDFPSGFVQYDPEERMFVFAEKYAADLKRDIDRLLMESERNKRKVERAQLRKERREAQKEKQ